MAAKIIDLSRVKSLTCSGLYAVQLGCETTSHRRTLEKTSGKYYLVDDDGNCLDLDDCLDDNGPYGGIAVAYPVGTALDALNSK